ncbi:MAG: hypothetical protein HQL32_05635 [Planctomycetes bacterium]|nr:hypothetical protein [Planctomycetota bacterium]
MNNLIVLFFFISFSVLVSGCQNKSDEGTPFDKGTALSWSNLPVAAYESKDSIDPVFFEAPNLAHNIQIVSGFENSESLSEALSLKIERAWRTKDRFHFIIAIKNDTAKGTRATFYLFSYDEMGRLLSTKQEDIYPKANESIFKQFSYKFSGQEKSWSVSVK